MSPEQKKANFRLAMILASIALVMFLSIIVKIYVLGAK